MPLSAHDLQILDLAAVSPEGRIGFGISEEGTLQFYPTDRPSPVPAGDALPRLDDLGYLRREVNRSYVLTPRGWDAVAGAGHGR
ncbi:MAG TPA: hypothetical protein VF804_01400 [Holophagaceae bacterium]